MTRPKKQKTNYMKKIYLTLTVALLATASYAQKTIVQQSQLPAFLQSHTELQGQQAKAALERMPLGSDKKVAAPFKAKPFDLIDEQPEGELKTYVGDLGSYYSIFGYIMPSVDNGRACDVVFGENNTVYFKDPFSDFITGTWLKGLQKGDTITVYPQPIYYEPATDTDDEMTAYASKMTYGWNEEYGRNYWNMDTLDMELKFVISNDSIILQNDHGFTGLGLFYADGSWTGFGEYRKILTPQNDTPVTLPDGLTPETYVMTYESLNASTGLGEKKRQVVTLYRDGSDVYLSDLTEADDNLFAKGTLADGKLTVKSGQYMGVAKPNGYNAGAYHDYIEALGWKTVPTYGSAYEDSTYFVDQITFDYDEATSTYTGEDLYLAVNGGKDKPSVRNGFRKPILSPFTEVKAAPAKPGLYSVEDCYDEYGYSYLELNLTDSTAEGQFLDTRRIYYNITIDDELFTFFPDEYVMLTDEMTDVPFGYVDNEDFQTYRGRRVVYLFTTGFSKVGLVEYYLDTDGVKHFSEPTFWYKDATAISQAAISDNASQPVAVSYCDLSGRTISQPIHGIYLQTTKYADGTAQTQKILVR